MGCLLFRTVAAQDEDSGPADVAGQGYVDSAIADYERLGGPQAKIPACLRDQSRRRLSAAAAFIRAMKTGVNSVQPGARFSEQFPQPLVNRSQCLQRNDTSADSRLIRDEHGFQPRLVQAGNSRTHTR